MASYIINDKRHAEKKDDIDSESRRIIKAPAKLIKSEMRARNYNCEVYPTNNDIKNVECKKKWVTSLLQEFMEPFIGQEVKALAISHSMIPAVKPRSVITPILFGVAVEMDHVFASKWLVNELSRLGFSMTYDELTWFKQSAIQMNDSGSTAEAYPG